MAWCMSSEVIGAVVEWPHTRAAKGLFSSQMGKTKADVIPRFLSGNRKSGVLLESNEMGAAIDTLVGESPIGKRHRVLVGLARVTTKRRPSVLAASDVYRSRPEVSR